MKIAAHITFFYNENRLVYLKEVVSSLLELTKEIDVFIYTNIKSDLFPKFKNVKCLYYNYKVSKFNFSYRSVFNKVKMKNMLHPFYLTWENREIIRKIIDHYDIQIYLEDDIKFSRSNLEYWLKYNKSISKDNYNLGFLRIEMKNTEKYITDLKLTLKELVTIDGNIYAINNINPYCGFWIYSKEELKNFIKSKEWTFDFTGYGIREKSAIGWHGKKMLRYKSTLIPLEDKKDRYVTIDGCTVYHLPNNYINHGSFCTIKFPITILK